MAALQSFLVCVIFAFAAILIPTSTSAQLIADFYQNVCPGALPTIRSVVRRAIRREPRMGASLLRLHFHDCFVNGCDGSVLPDDTANFTGEKTAFPNLNSLGGFDVADQIKAAVEKYCNASVVSCADILAVAARDSVQTARCTTFRARIYIDTNIDKSFAASVQQVCPELFKGDNSESDRLVQYYSYLPGHFARDFGASMIKMGNMKPLTGNDGEVRLNCSKIN
ncbi:hypothetical protein SO802_018509 [Lithocarpus litseifolius]|uniref:peroxidase n=1 Tax=Lithocarpus litseifolius TaxID=425828 RepID=A0AAW2CMK5_9ROSI